MMEEVSVKGYGLEVIGYRVWRPGRFHLKD